MALDEFFDDGEILPIAAGEARTPQADHDLDRLGVNRHGSPLIPPVPRLTAAPQQPPVRMCPARPGSVRRSGPESESVRAGTGCNRTRSLQCTPWRDKSGKGCGISLG